MSVPSVERQTNLTRLCRELQALAQELQVPVSPSPAAEKLSAELFLSHSTADKKFAEICAAQIISSRARLALQSGWAVPAGCDEAVLGTSNYVFFYTGPFRYPNSGCGLLFAQSLEVEQKDSGMATPFDSGGLLRHIARPDPAESVQSFLARHEMPIPEHRRYLAHVMTALFNSPNDYVEGISQCRSSPIGLSGGDERQWTHEVRIPERVQVQGSAHLQAVFAPRARVAVNRPIRALFKWCQHENVDTILIETPKSDDFQALQRTCLSYIRRKLY